MALTDKLQTYEYNSRPSEAQWNLKWSGTYLSACLTQISSFKSGGQGLFDQAFLTAATDGHIALWHDPQSGRQNRAALDSAAVKPAPWTIRKRIHQNAINALSCLCLSETAAIIVTGGDDNAVGVSILRWEPGSSKAASDSTSVDTLLIPKTHAAAVTALKVLPSWTACGREIEQTMILVTASNDQRTKFWNIKVDLARPGVEGIEISKISKHFTPVADIAAIDSVELSSTSNLRGIITCGVGMELWTIGEPA